MSYDLYLVDDAGSVTELPREHYLIGGTFALGGTTRAWLNVTYNYSEHFYKVLGDKGIRSLYGMKALDSIPLLLCAIDKLADDVTDDYWEPTEGNAKEALKDLLELARLAPDGTWEGD